MPDPRINETANRPRGQDPIKRVQSYTRLEVNSFYLRTNHTIGDFHNIF